MTRIVAVETHPVTMPLERALWTAHEKLTHSSLILTEIRTDDGLVGYGQIHGSPMPRICEWVRRFSDVIVGMDALANVAVWERLFALTSPRPGAIRGHDGLPPLPRAERPQIMAAIAGIDIALWDLKGKAAGMPVYRLLGGEKRSVFTYATGGYYDSEGAGHRSAEELAGFVRNGYKAVKLKCGAERVSAEAARVRAARDAIGEALLMLDMNAAYDLDECIAFAHAVEPYRIAWLEEPLRWYLQPADFVRLAGATRIPLAHGERELMRFTARDLITSGAIGYVQFDATRHAGFTEALRVAHLADHYGVRIAPHHAPELHAHLVSAFPRSGDCVESHGAPDRDPVWFGLYTERAEIRESHVHLSERPGFGIEIDWAFVNAHRA